MSKQRNKGTSYETRVSRYMRDVLQEPSIERRAMHGSKDMGDLYGICCHGFSGIAECKSHADYAPALVARWREETLTERGNADADFALLVVDRYRAPMGRSDVHVTLRDLARIALPVMVNGGWEEVADESWVRMTLDEALALMGGGAGEDEQWQ